MTFSSLPRLQFALSAYSLVLITISLWILLAQLASPGLTTLPTTPQQAASAAQYRSAARWAASFGALRGDLWAELSYTYAELQWADTKSVDALVVEQAKASTVRAVSLAPANSAVWLLIAELAARYAWQSPSPIEAMKMSYYTGPEQRALRSLRVRVSGRLDISADPELERLFQREIEAILTSQPDLKPALLDAYAQARPRVRSIIEDTAKRVDPAFAQALSNSVR